MDNVIYGMPNPMKHDEHLGVCDPLLHNLVLNLHKDNSIYSFKSVQSIAKITGLRISVIKAIIKRARK